MEQINLADYYAIKAIVKRTLPKLDFDENPDHYLAGHELLAVLNRLGALLESKKGDQRTDNSEESRRIHRL